MPYYGYIQSIIKTILLESVKNVIDKKVTLHSFMNGAISFEICVSIFTTLNLSTTGNSITNENWLGMFNPSPLFTPLTGNLATMEGCSRTISANHCELNLTFSLQSEKILTNSRWMF